jgi:Tfp pilus assembly protein PilO
MNGTAWSGRLAYLVRRGGVPAWAGLACLAAALVFFLLVIMPTSDLLAQLNYRKQAAQAQQAKGKAEPVLTPAQQLAVFYKDFPAGSAIPEVLARTYQIAGEQQLALELGEYVMNREQGARLEQFRITLPVKGSYPQVRKFVSEVLLAQPALSLQSLTVRRDKVALDVVDARVVLVLFLERAP